MKKFSKILMLLAVLLTVPLASRAQVSLPIMQDFETGNVTPWTLQNCHTSTEVATSAAHEGSYGLKFYYTENPPQYLISPELVPTTGNTDVSFWYMAYSSSYDEEFAVGYSTTTNATSAFTWLPSVTVTNTSWDEYTCTVPAGTKYVAIRSSAYDAFYLYIDDIYIGEAPSCVKVSEVAATAITSNELTLTWVDAINGTGTTYSIYNDTVLVADNISDTSYTISNLSPNTLYNFGVQAVCSDGEGSFIKAISVRTACAAITTLPYTCGFETTEIPEGSNQVPFCWTKINDYSSTSYPYSYSSYARTGSRSLYTYVGTTSSYANRMFAVLPEIDITENPLDGLTLTFYARMSNATASFNLQIGTMADPTDTTTFTLVQTVAVAGTTYQRYDIPLMTAPSTDAYVAFRYLKSNITSSAYVAIDDVKLDVTPSCIHVENVTVDTVTATSVILSWTDSYNTGATYSIYNMANGSLLASNIDATTYEIEDLASSTTFLLGVTANCSATEESDTMTVSATTLCATVVFDGTENYIENFNNITSGIPNCWDNSEGTVTTSSYRWNYYATGHEGHGLRFDSYNASNGQTNFLATPPIQLGADAILSFWYKNPAGGDFSVLISTEGSTTRTVLASDLTGVADWTYKMIPLDPDTYTNETVTIYFKATSNWGSGDAYIYLDDVTIMSAPDCPMPTAINISNITTTGAHVTVVDSNDSPSYEVVVYTPTDTVANNTFTTNEFDISNLTANTAYVLKLVATCDDGNSYPPMSVSFRTPCVGIENDSLPWVENFDTYSTGAFSADCWSIPARYSTSYPSVSTSQHVSGANSLYMYGTTTSPTMVALPAFADDLENLMVSFSLYKGSASYNIEVGVMSNPMDANSFVTLQTYSPSATSTWERFDQTFAGYTTGNIAFRSKSSIYIDSIVVDVLPACTRPSSVVVSNIATDGAEITIADANDVNSYVMVLKANDGILVDSSACGNQVTLSNLTANTPYTLRVYTVCTDGSLTPDYSTASFRTSCATYATADLPWTEGFESYTAVPLPCYAALPADFSSNAINTTDTRIHTGVQSLRFSGYANPPIFVILPPFESDISALQLTLWMLAENASYSGSLSVGYITNPTDSNSFVPVATFSASDYTTYQYEEITFANAPAGARIAISQNNPGSNYWWWIDDLTVDLIPACTRPVLTLSDTTTTGVTVHFSDPNEVNHYLLFVDNNPVGIEVTGDSYDIQNLLPGTTHSVYAMTLCSTGDTTNASAVVSFFTDCAVITHNDLPFTEDFESWATGSTSAFNPCWTKLNYYTTSSTNYPYITTSNGTKALYFYPGYSYQPQFAVLPEMDSVNDLMITFKVKGSSYCRMNVGVMSNPTDTTTFTSLFLIPTMPSSSDWTEYEVRLTSYTDTGHYIAFRAGVNSSYGWSAYVDDIVVSVASSCDKAQDLVVRNVTTTSAELLIVDTAFVGSYNVSLIHGTDTVTATYTDTVVSLTNLTEGTPYTIIVTSNCSDGAVTLPIQTTFGTPATPATVPYSTGFETGDDQQWEFVQTTTNGWYIGSAVNNGGSQSLYVSNDGGVTNGYTSNSTVTFASRVFDLQASTPYTLSFDWMAGGENPSNDWDYLSVYLAPASAAPTATTGTTIPTSWQALNTSRMSQQTTWTNFMADVNVPTAGLYYIVFRWKVDASVASQPGAAIDNFTLGEITCPAPTALVAGTITETSIDFSWTAGGTETAWVVSIDGGAWQSTTTPSYSMTGLTPNTTYSIVVRALCGAEDTSFALRGSLHTHSMPCGDVTLFPYNEGFEDGLGCWTTIDVNNDGNTWMALGNPDSEIYPHTGDSMAASFSWNGSEIQADEYLVSPKFVLPQADSVKLSWWFKVNGGYPEDSLTVFVSTSGNSATDFTTAVYGIMPTEANGDWTQVNVDLSSYAGQPIYIAFFHTGYDANFLLIDDISLTLAGAVQPQPQPCAVPTDVHTTDFDSTSAVIDWTSTAASWKISVNNGAEVAVSSKPYTLTNLTPNTTYSVRVKAVCADGGESAWSTACTFRTNAGPSNPDDSTGIDDVYGSQIALYPNPATTTVTLDGVEGHATVTLVDLNGRKSGEWKVESGKLEIDLTGYAKGAYFVRIVGEKSMAVRKLIVK